MKKVLNYTLVLLSAFCLTLSCSKAEKNDVIDTNEGTETSVGKQITINATLSDALTRVAYTLDETGDKPKLSLEWQSSDVLVVVSRSENTAEFTNPTIDETGKNATFVGTLPDGGEPYTVSVKHADTMLDAEQNQHEDGDLGHIEYAAKATGVTQASLLNAAKESKTAAASAKKPTAAKKTAAKKTAAAAKKEEELKLTAAEKKLVELYRAADKSTKEAAVKVLKGEKTGADGIIGSILGGAVDLLSGKK